MTTTKIDPFTLKRLQETHVAERWMNLQRDHLRLSQELWLGMLLDNFTLEQLELIARSGYLCENDRIALRKANIELPLESRIES